MLPHSYSSVWQELLDECMGRAFQAQKRKLQTSSDRVWEDFTEDIVPELGIEECREFADWTSGKRYKVTSEKSQCFLEMAGRDIKSKSK